MSTVPDPPENQSNFDTEFDLIFKAILPLKQIQNVNKTDQKSISKKT